MKAFASTEEEQTTDTDVHQKMSQGNTSNG
jgi:hypothetical protein